MNGKTKICSLLTLIFFFCYISLYFTYCDGETIIAKNELVAIAAKDLAEKLVGMIKERFKGKSFILVAPKEETVVDTIFEGYFISTLVNSGIKMFSREKGVLERVIMESPERVKYEVKMAEHLYKIDGNASKDLPTADFILRYKNLIQGTSRVSKNGEEITVLSVTGHFEIISVEDASISWAGYLSGEAKIRGEVEVETGSQRTTILGILALVALGVIIFIMSQQQQQSARISKESIAPNYEARGAIAAYRW
jgi:preprotein translocase subunit SecG